MVNYGIILYAVKWGIRVYAPLSDKKSRKKGLIFRRKNAENQAYLAL